MHRFGALSYTVSLVHYLLLPPCVLCEEMTINRLGVPIPMKEINAERVNKICVSLPRASTERDEQVDHLVELNSLNLIKMLNLFNSIKVFNLLNLITFMGQSAPSRAYADGANQSARSACFLDVNPCSHFGRFTGPEQRPVHSFERPK